MCKTTEDLNRYVSMLHGLAAEHLMKEGSISQFRIVKLPQITLLSNALLFEASLANYKLCLIGMTEKRNKRSIRSDNPFKLKLEEAQKISLSTRKLSVSIVRDLGSSSHNRKLLFKKFKSRFNAMYRDAKPIFDNMVELRI